MADPPKAKAGSSKKGRIALYSVLGLGGIAAAYWLYTKYQANAASTAAVPADTTPATTTVGTSTTPTYGSATTLAQWQAQALQYMTTTLGIKGGENTAATGLTAALSGHCVGPNEFAALNSTLGAIGQPPGGGILTIKQCGKAAGSSTTTSHTPTSTPASPRTATAVVRRATTAATRRTNVIDAARRRANDVAAAARRRANAAAAAARRPRPGEPRGTILPQQRRAGV